MVAGDVMLARTIGAAIQRDGPGIFEGVTAPLGLADLLFVNLECSVSDTGHAVEKSYTFRAPPRAIEALTAAGVDAVGLANNHSLDYGPDALFDTIDRLTDAGIQSAGAGGDEAAAHAPTMFSSAGAPSVAMLSFVDAALESPEWPSLDWAARPDRAGLAYATPESIARDVAAARATADVVVVMLHAGLEYDPTPNASQQTLASAAIEAGAALVVGHHPHVLQRAERIGSSLIAYSLGNLVFDNMFGEANDSAILDVTLSADGVQEVRWHPIVLVTGLPRPAHGPDAARILARLGGTVP